MHEQLSEHPSSVDRHGVAAFLRHAIAIADSAPRAMLHARSASPAGISLDLWFDDCAMADLYSSRLAIVPAQAGQAPIRLHVLSHMGQLPSWSDVDFDAPTFHLLLREAGLRAAYPYQQQVWQALDMQSGIGVHLARSPGDLPLWHAGSPLRQHLHWQLQVHGKRIAHAATLGQAGRGILLLGSGGAGKSGTTLAGIAAGLKTVGDDYVALGGSPTALATPLFRIVKQDRRGIERIGNLREKTASLPENWMRKVEFDPAAIFPDCFVEALEIRAIVLPRIARVERSQFVAITGGEAMRSLIPTNLLQFSGEPDDGMSYYANLVRHLPAYRLELSNDSLECGAALRAFIDKL